MRNEELPRLFHDGYGAIYPDTHDDVLGGPVRQVRYETVVLENRHLRITIMPELGGKIWSVYDKHARRETLHVPDCVKPGLILLRGAWIAGGMEFNFPIGHHVDTMARLPVRITEAGGEQAAAVIERQCRRTGLRMEIRVGLRADEACFDLQFTVSNPTPVSKRWYQWTNVGVTASTDWRFFAKGNLYTSGSGLESYPVDSSGKDISWYKNRPVAGDNFMVGLREDYFGCYDFAKEHGLAHWAPWQEVPGKKYFTWGSTRRVYDSGGNLNDTGDDYLEIQTGPMQTQAYYAMLGPGESKSFGGTWMPYRQIGGIEWACRGLIFNVRNGTPWLYATTDVRAEVIINGRGHRVEMAAGETVRLRRRVNDGDKVEIVVNGRKERSFAYPLKGRMEPNAGRHYARQEHLTVAAWGNRVPKGASAALAVAREMVKQDFPARALAAYRRVLAMRPGMHEARVELAELLMRMGDFAGADKELVQLAGTRLAGQAEKLLGRREAAKEAFLAPVMVKPAGVARDLRGRSGMPAMGRSIWRGGCTRSCSGPTRKTPACTMARPCTWGG